MCCEMEARTGEYLRVGVTGTKAKQETIARET